MIKLLIIGAGIGQVHITRLAKEMGMFVAVVSPPGDYPAISLADEWFDCDIYDVDSIVRYAQKNGFTAVTSDQNDLMMPTVAAVAERLHLPGNSYLQTISYCDKNRFRAVCRKAGVPVPESIEIRELPAPDLQQPLPWIVKPADSQSSIGITKVEHRAVYPSAVEYALQKSKRKTAIVEQFIQGEEIVCEGFVYQGCYYNLALGDRRYFRNTLIPSQTLFPSLVDSDLQTRMIECEKKIAGEIGASFGIIHSEYIVNRETGNVYPIESAIRGGGVYISSHLIPLATGININRLLLRCASGEADAAEVASCFAQRQQRASAYVCFTLPEGRVATIKGIEQVSAIPGVEMCEIRHLSVGDITERMTAKGMRKGPIVLSAENRQELEQLVTQVQHTLNVTVMSPQGALSSIIWG